MEENSRSKLLPEDPFSKILKKPSLKPNFKLNLRPQLGKERTTWLVLVLALSLLLTQATAQVTVDKSLLKNSEVMVEYKGFNRYFVCLMLKDSTGDRVNNTLERNPVLRIQDVCEHSIFGYCGQVRGNTLNRDDIVESLEYMGMGMYATTVDLGDNYGDFTPVIYTLYDQAISLNYFNPDSDMKRPDFYTHSDNWQNSDTELTFPNATSTSGLKVIVSSMLSTTTSQDMQYRIVHDNCVTLKINGETLYTSESTCAEGNSMTHEFNLTLGPDLPKYMEVLYTQVSPNSDFTFEFYNGTSTAWEQVATDYYRPLVFTESVTQNVRYGDHPTASYVKAIGGIVIGFTVISLLVSWFVQIKKNVRTQAHYSLIHHIQLLILTPLIGIYIGTNVENFYDFMDFYLFNFNWLGQGVVFTDTSKTKPALDFYQNERYSLFIGLESASAFYNLGQLIFVGCLITLVYLLVAVIYFLSYNRDEQSREGKYQRALSWLMKTLYWTFSIRFFVLSYVFLWLCCMMEMADTNRNVHREGSWIFSFLLLVALVVLLIVSLVHSIFTKNDPKKLPKLEELFRGCKETTLARLWPVLFMVRTAIFVIIIASIQDLARYGEVSIIFIAQTAYILLIVVIRPFTHWVDFVCEVLNGVMYWVALVALYWLDGDTKWEEGVDHMYLSFICVTAFANTILIIIWAVTVSPKDNTDSKLSIVIDVNQEKTQGKKETKYAFKDEPVVSLPPILSQAKQKAMFEEQPHTAKERKPSGLDEEQESIDNMRNGRIY